MSAATGRTERSEGLGFPWGCITPMATACVSSPGTRTLTLVESLLSRLLRCREQPPVKLRIVKRLGQRTAQPLFLGAADVPPHRHRRDIRDSGNCPAAQTCDMVKPQDLSYLAYGQPLCRHREPSRKIREGPTVCGCPASPSPGPGPSHRLRTPLDDFAPARDGSTFHVWITLKTGAIFDPTILATILVNDPDLQEARSCRVRQPGHRAPEPFLRSSRGRPGRDRENPHQLVPSRRCPPPAPLGRTPATCRLRPIEPHHQLLVPAEPQASDPRPIIWAPRPHSPFASTLRYSPQSPS